MDKRIVYAFVTNDLTYDQRMQRICTSLHRNRYEVTLVGRSLPDSAPIIDQVFNQNRLPCFFQKGIAFYLEMNIRLFFFMLGKKVDFIHAADLDTIGAATAVKFIKRCKVVFDAHEYFTEVPELEGKRWKKKIWTMLGKLCVPRIDTAITVSEPLQPILSEKYEIEFDLIRNFPLRIQGAVNTQIIQSRKKIILYQGVVNKGRGVLEMMRIMRKLTAWKLWIVGEGDLYEECLELKEELKLGEQVKLWGYVSPEKLNDITLQAKIGLNLLQGKSKNYLYSSANKFFDYIRASLPCLTMDFETYRKVVERHKVAVLLSDLNEARIIAAVQEIDENYDAYIAACTEARELYVWEKEATRLLAIYDKL